MAKKYALKEEKSMRESMTKLPGRSKLSEKVQMTELQEAWYTVVGVSVLSVENGAWVLSQ